jgi:acetyl-CoA carboxylase alpha subunit/acetyl-CoA carboxylase beta subunit
MTRLNAYEMIDVLVDEGSWASWDNCLPDVEASAEYADELACARAKTGVDEAVLTGAASIHGHRVAIAVCEFGFLGGSIGVSAGDRLTTAIRRATAQRLPLLVLPTSGGTRMQEGTTALRHPTTGGVFASWGSLGHLTVGEPGALIGFLGPRVYEALHDRPFPSDVQTAENLYRHGFLDALCHPPKLAGIVGRALDILSAPRHSPVVAPVPDRAHDAVPAWVSVRATRHLERPGVQDLLAVAATEVVALHGTGQGEVDAGLIVALARFEDVSCVLLGQDRLAQSDIPIGPAALRQARRGMRLAAELGLPLVSVIDTPGAALSRDAEEGGVAGEIARCIADMISLDVPTLSVLLGQGTGGAALALFPADRTLAAAHGWLSPLPPEGASAILHHTTQRAPDVADRQGVRAADLLASGALDRIIPEYPDARREPEQFCGRVAAAIRQELASLATLDPGTRLRRRIGRFDRLATPAPAVAAESA